MFIFTFLYYCVISVPSCILIYKWFEENYPNETEETKHRIMWYALRVETQVQMTMGNIRQFLNENVYIPTYTLLYPNLEDKCITFVKNGHEVLNTTLSNVINKNESPEYDMIWYSIDDIMMRFNDVKKIKEIEKTTEIIQSSIKFLSVDVTVIATNFEEKFRIEFGDKNFYIEGNILFDKPFIEWYLYEYHYLNMNDLENVSFMVSLIDNNITVLTLADNESVVLSKDSYELQ